LRGRENVLKRLLIHVGSFNLSLAMRKLLGKGTPRGFQGFSADALLIFLGFWIAALGTVEEDVPLPMSTAHETMPVDVFTAFAAE
jgi:hypothetical protein